jgi:hypothetical protein
MTHASRPSIPIESTASIWAPMATRDCYLAVNKHRSGTPGHVRAKLLMLFVDSADNRGPDRRRSGPHPERISSCYIKALRSSDLGSRFGACSQQPFPEDIFSTRNSGIRTLQRRILLHKTGCSTCAARFPALLFPRRRCRRRSAASKSNHSARSTSGKAWRLPLRGGHSMSKVLLELASRATPVAIHFAVPLGTVGLPS